MADGELLPRHAEISESFENANLARTWRAADPNHTDPATLTGNDLTAYKKWESDTQAEWAQASRRVVQEYDRLNAFGLGPGPGRAVVADPTFPRNNADAPWYALRALSRPKDTDGDPMNVTALPDAWAAVRRNPRDLAGVLDAMRTAATASAGPAYYKSALSSQFEGQVASAMDAVTAWTRLVTRTADPSLADLTRAANEVNTRLDLVLKTAHGVAADVAAVTGVTVPEVPAPLTDGVVMFIAAVADEICNQYAARIADPSFGLMFERISEIPSREDVPSPGSQDYANSSAEAQRLDPKHALDFLQTRLLHIQGLELTDYQAQALADATRVADFDSLSAAWKIWRTQLDAVPRQDMAKLKTSISDLAFGLEQLRGAVSDALFQAPDLRVHALAPIDGLVALVQVQAEQAKALLR